MIKVSVIICTHNPRENYLKRVLDALDKQTLPRDRWELLLIDNGSKESLATKWDLSWHPAGRHIYEDELGLTPARLRGIREATGEMLVFVDDDNVLSPEYLEKAIAIGNKHLFLGAWGGSSVGEFEEKPAEWLKPRLQYIGVRKITCDLWSNLPLDFHTSPIGAGMVVRRPVAIRYSETVAGDPLRRQLGRRGPMLLACEDLDLASTSCDLGMGKGVFADLQLTHLIPRGRVQAEYIFRLREGSVYARCLFNYIRAKLPVPQTPSLLRRFRLFSTLAMTKGGIIHAKLLAAEWKGMDLARRDLKSQPLSVPDARSLEI